MSALDEAIDAVRSRDMSGTMHATANAAEAELALLRRCREAVVALPEQWWRDNWYGGTDCIMCGQEISDVDHAPDCQGLAIDALAKEVRGE